MPEPTRFSRPGRQFAGWIARLLRATAERLETGQDNEAQFDADAPSGARVPPKHWLDVVQARAPHLLIKQPIEQDSEVLDSRHFQAQIDNGAALDDQSGGPPSDRRRRQPKFGDGTEPPGAHRHRQHLVMRDPAGRGRVDEPKETTRIHTAALLNDRLHLFEYPQPNAVRKDDPETVRRQPEPQPLERPVSDRHWISGSPASSRNEGRAAPPGEKSEIGGDRTRPPDASSETHRFGAAIDAWQANERPREAQQSVSGKTEDPILGKGRWPELPKSPRSSISPGSLARTREWIRKLEAEQRGVKWSG